MLKNNSITGVIALLRGKAGNVVVPLTLVHLRSSQQGKDTSEIIISLLNDSHHVAL